MWRDRLEHGRAALDEAVPDEDLWQRALDKAERPANASERGGGRRMLRVLVAAALVVAAAGVVVVTANEDDGRVRTTPADVDSDTTAPGTVQGETVPLDPPCGHLVIRGGGQQYDRFDLSESQTAVPIRSQPPDAVFADDEGVVLEVHSPGMVVRDLVGEQVEDISLNGDDAQIWVSEHFVQVRSFPDPADECASVTVTASQGALARSAGELRELRRAAALDLAGRIAVSPEPLPAPDGAAQATTGEPFALWPETDRSLLPAEEPEWSSSIESTAVTFATEVLEWNDAVVTTAPAQVDAGTHVLTIASPSRKGSAVVWASPLAAGRWRVTGVDSRPGDDPSASVQVIEDSATATAGPAPEGTATTTVRFQYGDSVSEGSAGAPTELDRSADVAGSVIVLYRDAAGNVIGAWGTPLPAGDFAAG